MAGLGSRLRVLAVDDDPTVLLLLHGILTQAGVDVDQSQNVESALVLLGQMAYSLLITDLQLPDASGLDLLRKLRETHPALPVVLISGALDAATRREAELLGRVECMSKPLDRGRLLTLVKTLLTEEQPG
jgi:DNA-binding NtrC family response regulator